MESCGHNKSIWVKLICLLSICLLFALSLTVQATDHESTDEDFLDDYLKDAISGYVIGIDPCNQKTTNTETEPLHPTSDRRVFKATAGIAGVKTDVREYELNLIIAKRLAKRLTDAGATVVLTREGSDIDLSNAKRAEMMNHNKVNFWIRISCNSSPDPNISGALISTPSRAYAKNIYARSLNFAKSVAAELQKLIGDDNVAIHALANQAAFNYSDSPVIDVGVGYLTNPSDDLSLNRERYITDLVSRIFSGIQHFNALENYYRDMSEAGGQ